MSDAVVYAPPKPKHSSDSIYSWLERAPYREVRRFLAKNSIPRYPRHFYKYRGPVDSDAKHLRDILIESRLWLSSPCDFNDPFDMKAYVTADGDGPALRERFKELVDEQGKKQGLNWKQRQQMVDALMARPRDEWLSRLRNAYEKNINDTGVYSFSGDPRHILMWSHYARDHSGICLQFETARSPVPLLEAVPVKYVTDHPVYDWVADSPEDRTQIESTLRHKFEAWTYEREWRIIWPRGAHTYVRINPAAITSIILGCRASAQTIANLKRVLEDRAASKLPAVRTFAARQHPRRYAVTIHRLPL